MEPTLVPALSVSDCAADLPEARFIVRCTERSASRARILLLLLLLLPLTTTVGSSGGERVSVVQVYLRVPVQCGAVESLGGSMEPDCGCDRTNGVAASRLQTKKRPGSVKLRHHGCCLYDDVDDDSLGDDKVGDCSGMGSPLNGTLVQR
jgi:hypothetical protein